MRKAPLILAFFTMTTWSFAKEAPQVPGEILVKFKAGKGRHFFQDQTSWGPIITEHQSFKLSYGDFAVLKTSDTEALKKLKGHPDIDYAEPNFIYSVNGGGAPNDPEFEKLWGLQNTGSNDPRGTKGVAGADINVLKAWDITRGSKKIKIAVIDTGVDYLHPDLRENIWVNKVEAEGVAGVDDDGNGYIDDIHGYDFAYNDPEPLDGNGHGTHCAGTIGAVHDNGLGVAGVMADVSLVPIKFLEDSGSGSLVSAIKAIDYGVRMNVDIMSNSWGGGAYSEALLEAIKVASDKGIIFVAAAGNTSTNNDLSPTYPATYDVPNIISVAAFTAQNTLSSFSSYGKRKVHIAAPGTNILSTFKDGSYNLLSGTSMATPHVAGALGLLLAKEGRMSPVAVKDRLLVTSVQMADLKGKTMVGSRVDAYNLLADLRPPRTGPRSDAWKTKVLEKPLESGHPYESKSNVTKTITIPGAKYVRVKVERFETESDYDYLKIMNDRSKMVEKISGNGHDYVSDEVEGDTVMINFTSDSSIQLWGYVIREIEYQ